MHTVALRQGGGPCASPGEVGDGCMGSDQQYLQQQCQRGCARLQSRKARLAEVGAQVAIGGHLCHSAAFRWERPIARGCNHRTGRATLFACACGALCRLASALPVRALAAVAWRLARCIAHWTCMIAALQSLHSLGKAVSVSLFDGTGVARYVGIDLWAASSHLHFLRSGGWEKLQPATMRTMRTDNRRSV